RDGWGDRGACFERCRVQSEGRRRRAPGDSRKDGSRAGPLQLRVSARDYTPGAEWPKGRKDMRLRLCATIFALALITLATGTAASASSARMYYVSLGDSLAAGTQPGHFSTNESYTDQLFADLRAGRPTLQHLKLGCPGETTASIQKFVALVTIDVGPNDLFRGGGVPAITTNLP